VSDGGDDFVRAVPLKEIEENDYNLNVTLYAFPHEEVEEIDIAREWEEIRTVENEIKRVEEKISSFLEAIENEDS